MRRVLFHWRGLTVWSYPAMLYLGLVFGVAAGNAAANFAGLDSLRVYAATVALLIPALVAARLLYVASEWNLYRSDLRRIWNQRDGGLMMLGSVPAMLLCSVPLLGALHINFGAFWDVSTFTILVGMIFARLGCLLNGCCAGRRWQGLLSMYLPDHRGIWQGRIPTQLLEMACASILLVISAIVWRHMPFSGALFLIVLLSYSSVRLLLELARQRENRGRQSRIVYFSTVAFVVASVSILALKH